MAFKFTLISLLTFLFVFHKPGFYTVLKPGNADSTVINIKPADRYLIVPGVRIGRFVLDSSARKLPAILGKPAYTDSSMGSALLRWNIKRNGVASVVSIFTDKPDRKAEFMLVRKILVSSPLYKTAEGLHTGLPFNTYAKFYKLKIVRTYMHKGHKILIYNEKSSGISFEIDDQTKTGVAIVIYKIKDSAAPYINMH